MSSFFFKTAKHDAPVWQTKRERNDAFAREVLRAATAASNERLLDDDDDDDDDDDARPAVESDAFDWHAPRPPSRTRPRPISPTVFATTTISSARSFEEARTANAPRKYSPVVSAPSVSRG